MITPPDIGLPLKFRSFRKEVRQWETIQKLSRAESRFQLLQAPPGCGKTMIGNGVGLLGDHRYLYLTRTKGLQYQNYSDMSSIGMVDIVGHSNYPCSSVSYDDQGELADLECKGRKERGIDGCDYRLVVDRCLKTDKVSTNYSHWIQLYKSGDPDRLNKFTLLILDEAHTIHSTLAESASLKVFYSQVERLLEINRNPGEKGSIQSWVEWAMEAEARGTSLLNSGNRSYASRDRFYLERLVKQLTRIYSEYDYAEWVLIPLPSSKGVQFKPLNVAQYAEPYLFRGVEKILLMSATLFKDDGLTLGIDQSQDVSTFLSIQSAFPAKRRPIIYFPSAPSIKIDKNLTPRGRKIWIDQIDRILEFEGETKGIIQSRSYQRADDILSLSSKRSQILTHSSTDSREIINQYRKSSPPCTIISPILEEGEDFPFDLCDYVIWPKLPFLDMRQPYIKALAQKDKDYPNRELCRTLIQGSLRGMRFTEDWCRIWITCAHWKWVKNLPWFYGWFRAAFVSIDRLEQAPRRPE